MTEAEVVSCRELSFLSSSSTFNRDVLDCKWSFALDFINMFIIAVGTHYGTRSVLRMQFLHQLSDSGLVNIWVQQMNHLMSQKHLPLQVYKIP